MLIYVIYITPLSEPYFSNRLLIFLKLSAMSYKSEADPIALKMLRGEATEAEWLAKVEEIKSRYPYV